MRRSQRATRGLPVRSEASTPSDSQGDRCNEPKSPYITLTPADLVTSAIRWWVKIQTPGTSSHNPASGDSGLNHIRTGYLVKSTSKFITSFTCPWDAGRILRKVLFLIGVG